MKILSYIVGILLIILLAIFSVSACILSSKIKKYEDLDRGDPKEGGPNE